MNQFQRPGIDFSVGLQWKTLPQAKEQVCAAVLVLKGWVRRELPRNKVLARTVLSCNMARMSAKHQPHYVILQASSTTELQLKVNEYLGKDYKPVGGVSVTAEIGAMGQAHSRLIQAMLFTPGPSTHSNPPGSRSPQKH